MNIMKYVTGGTVEVAADQLVHRVAPRYLTERRVYRLLEHQYGGGTDVPHVPFRSHQR